MLFEQKTAYNSRISDWSSDVCASDLHQQQSVEEFRGIEGIEGQGIRLAPCRGAVARIGVVARVVPIGIVEVRDRQGARGTVAVDDLLFTGDLGADAQIMFDCPGREISSQVELGRSEEHTSELQSLMRHSYAVVCLKHKNQSSYTLYQT